uniref:Uncharacterized protein n=1 Tax=Arundo donax TaxID=35708 RepID=A0A0A8YI65_ARUDO
MVVDYVRMAPKRFRFRIRAKKTFFRPYC